MIRSRRSAARTLVLLRLAQACARGGRLEMISVWLLFLRLLRATTGVRRPDGNEITDGETESIEQQQKDQGNLSTAPPMETSQLEEECRRNEDGPDAHFSEFLDTGKGSCRPRVQDKTDDGTDDSENVTELEGTAMQQAEGEIKKESDLKESDQEPTLQSQPVKEETKSNAEETGCREQSQIEEDTKHTMACNTKKTALQGPNEPMEEGNKAKESTQHPQDQPTEEETNRTVSFDAQETALQEQDQLMEKETIRTMSCDAKEEQNQQVEGETKSTMVCNVNEAALQNQGQLMEEEPKSTMSSCEAKEADLQTQSVEEEANQVRRNSSVDSCYLAEVDVKRSFDATERDNQAEDEGVKDQHERRLTFDEKEADHQAKEEDYNVESQLMDEDDSNTSSAPEQDLQVQGSSVDEESNKALSFEAKGIDHHVEEPTVEDETRELSSDAVEGDLQLEKADNIPSSSELLDTETVLERQIKELAISDASTESCHDEDREDLSDCLHVEMAIVSSDSDNEEQWKSMFSPVVDEDDLEPDFSKERVHQDQAAEDDLTSFSEHKAEDLGVLEQPECPTELDLDGGLCDSVHYSSLSKIPEDDETTFRQSLQRLSASTSELDKKLPRDFCVVQDTKSDNVSTEHLDFKSARQQWQRMEEQSKGQVLQPTVKQENCQGGRGFTYTPVRNLEKSRRDPETEGLGLSLGDYPYTQFSPPSDDSGLDDASYRSHYDEPETPVEREIRETLEREESFRRERARSRPGAEEPLADKARPVSLSASGPDLDSRKLYNTREDRCRSQRSPSARSPTSPSPKTSYQEMVAKNVIILEPDPHPTNPRHSKSNLLSPTNRFHEWPTSGSSNVIILETSNLIIRSVSEFCLNTAGQETQRSTFHDNPFFKLRSHSTQSLVDREIKEVRQRDEEFRRQRALLYTREKYDTVLVSPSSPLSFTYDKPESSLLGGTPAKCKSSPSSPLRMRKMDRSTLSCDQKFPEAPVVHRVRRKSALVQRWEAAVSGNRHLS